MEEFEATHTLITNHPLGCLNLLFVVFDDSVDNLVVDLEEDSDLDLAAGIEDGQSFYFPEEFDLSNFISDFTAKPELLVDNLERMEIFEGNYPVIQVDFLSRTDIPARVDLENPSLSEEEMVWRFMQVIERVREEIPGFKAAIIPRGEIAGWEYEESEYRLDSGDLVVNEGSPAYIPLEMVTSYRVDEDEGVIELDFSLKRKLIFSFYHLLVLKEFYTPSRKLYFGEREQVSEFLEFLDYFIQTYHGNPI